MRPILKFLSNTPCCTGEPTLHSPQSLFISVCPLYRSVMSDVAQNPNIFAPYSIVRSDSTLYVVLVFLSFEASWPQNSNSHKRILLCLGSWVQLFIPAPVFVQARGRTSVLNQCRTQKQCGESTGSQVVWTLLLQSGVWNKPSYWEREREREGSEDKRPTSSGKYFSLQSHLLSLW